MKKRIFLFYFLTLFFIFILSLLWEFLLEPYLQPSFVAEFIPESTEDNWEYIKTIMVFCGLALLIPTYVALAIEEKRNHTVKALEVTDGVLEIHTANLAKREKWRCKQKEVHPPGEYVHLMVTNTGSEIPAENLEKIFDPFFSTKFTGRGLGLAAAKGIVQSHDGCIYVDGSPAGTTFHILLPKAVFDQEVMATESEPFVNIKGLRVLAVDDEPQVLSIIENLLTHHGCHVLTADKGSEALEIINRHKDDLDLVVLDIQMPGMSGDEVYRKLKVLNPAIRVLISSGYEEYTALQNIELDARRDRFIKKPFSMVELLQKVKEVLLQE